MTVWLSRQQCREADRFAIERLGIPGIVLMENAGAACADRLISLGPGDGVVICCGGGNNGGDGFVIARHLYNAGVNCKVILFSAPEQYRGDAEINLRIIEKLGLPIVQFDTAWSNDSLAEQLSTVGRDSATWIVDAMLGTGATGALRAPFDRVVPVINQLPMKRMAIDVPTGMDADTGAVNPTAVRADITCTFIASKLGFQNKAAWSVLGHITVVGIGVRFDFENLFA